MSSESHSAASLRGLLAATASFLLWGVIPLYWKQLQAISAWELIAHRIVWSLAFLFVLMILRRSIQAFWRALHSPKAVLSSLISSALLAINWTVYIWAVNSGHVIESSLGYFLTPLGNIALGYLVLHERLRLLQRISIVSAVLGVGVLLIGAGHFPWIALTLAISWSLYGIFKKQSSLGPVSGLALETLMLFPLAVALLLWRAHTGAGALGHVDVRTHVFVLSAGVVTTVPLVLFAYGAQRLRMATLGLLQYLAPTVQFLLGLYVYHEPFDAMRFNACVLIWVGLLIYTADSFWAQRRVFWSAANPPEPAKGQ